MLTDASDLLNLGNASVVAPAGHGKTEIIANVAALGQRALILTHTHAGVHAIRARLKRLGVPRAQVAVDTIAGWSMRYARAFPGTAKSPTGMPENAAEWNQLYCGVRSALNVAAVRAVVAASYDRVLIDEYQDCNGLQHELAAELARIVPTLIFGDPMQGIFEFAGATLSWNAEIHPLFPCAGTLETPHRWAGKNSELGQWIAETREKLLKGERIDLADPRITFRQSNSAFDLNALFEGIDDKEGSFAAIHCRKNICYRLAKAAGGGYQAIEEIAAHRLREFANLWDSANDGEGRLRAINSLLEDSFLNKPPANSVKVDQKDADLEAIWQNIEPNLDVENGAKAAAQIMSLRRKHSCWKPFRSELWHDAERAATEVADGRADSMDKAVANVRQRVSVSGRKLPKRTVSTPLLLKGLEFDHVIIPDASHFANEQSAQAKLFYVAISRATRSLTITAPERWLKLTCPRV